jgi:XTP/dITP diphosphohydrolase/tetrapyrrole methylase family protein/MazG family protein
VARDINDKLIRRHPACVRDCKLDTSEQVIAEWEKIKATEKKHGPAKDESACSRRCRRGCRRLMFAEAVWKQIEKKSLPAESLVDVAQVQALGRQLDEASLGKMLFELTAAARTKGLDPKVRCGCTRRR